jgi:SAM-dependent methyltransferase
MLPGHFIKDYSEHLARLKASLPLDDALHAVVGGEFEAIGRLEHALLEQYGLGDGPTRVIDVGCGTGRLAVQLASAPHVSFLGTEIVPEMLAFASRLCERPDWQFLQTDGIGIPAENESADYVCFFSVFTHLLHAETYRYLQEARRVLKPGGMILFTFLEFRIPCHWTIFEATTKPEATTRHLDQFMGRDAIEAWAQHLGLEIVSMEDGDKPHIPLTKPIIYKDGRIMADKGNFGQSVAVLQKSRPVD